MPSIPYNEGHLLLDSLVGIDEYRVEWNQFIYSRKKKRKPVTFQKASEGRVKAVVKAMDPTAKFENTRELRQSSTGYHIEDLTAYSYFYPDNSHAIAWSDCVDPWNNYHFHRRHWSQLTMAKLKIVLEDCGWAL